MFYQANGLVTEGAGELKETSVKTICSGDKIDDDGRPLYQADIEHNGR